MRDAIRSNLEFLLVEQGRNHRITGLDGDWIVGPDDLARIEADGNSQAEALDILADRVHKRVCGRG